MKTSMYLRCLVLSSALAVAGQAAFAEDLQKIIITLKDHKFTPSEIHVPTGKAVFLMISNQDPTIDEFDMVKPALEKMMPRNQQVQVRLPPLGPGRFPFTGEYWADTAKGVIVSE